MRILNADLERQAFLVEIVMEDLVSPRTDQRDDRHEICQRGCCRSQERNCGRGNPPVSSFEVSPSPRITDRSNGDTY
jgi:hypothetical protein